MQQEGGKPAANPPVADYFLARGAVERGPFTRAQIQTAAAAGKLQPGDLIWRKGMSQRKRVEEVAGLLPATVNANVPPVQPPLAAESLAVPAPAPASPRVPAAEGELPPPPDTRPKPTTSAPGSAVPGKSRVEQTEANAMAQMAARHGAARPRPSSFFPLAHWRGELSLATSFWGVGALCGLLLLPLITWFSSRDVSTDTSMVELGTKLFTAYGCALLIHLWLWVGIWRSAGRHRQAGGAAAWAWVTRIVVVLILLGRSSIFMTQDLPQLKEASKWVRGVDDVPQPRFTLLRDGAEMELQGGFAFGSARKFETFMRDHPEVKLVHLNSTGGRIDEAIAIGRLIRDRHVDTYTSTVCASACALAFLGGSQRFVGEKARLGFHSASYSLGNPIVAYRGNERQRELMRKFGVPNSFIDRAVAVSPVDMWFPTNEELRAASIITRAVSGYEFAISGLSDKERGEQSIEQELRKLAYVRALATYYPEDYARFKQLFVDGVKSGKSISDITDTSVSLLGKQLMPRLLVKAPDKTLVHFWTARLHKLQGLRKEDPQECAYSEFPQLGRGMQLPGLIADERKKRESRTEDLAVLEELIRTSAESPSQVEPPFGTSKADLQQDMLAIRLTNPKALEALANPIMHANETGTLCDAAILLYQNVLRRDDRRAANIMRMVQHSEQAARRGQPG